MTSGITPKGRSGLRWNVNFGNPGSKIQCFICKSYVGPEARYASHWATGSDYKTLCRSCGTEYERRINESRAES